MFPPRTGETPPNAGEDPANAGEAPPRAGVEPPRAGEAGTVLSNLETVKARELVRTGEQLLSIKQEISELVAAVVWSPVSLSSSSLLLEQELQEMINSKQVNVLKAIRRFLKVEYK